MDLKSSLIGSQVLTSPVLNEREREGGRGEGKLGQQQQGRWEQVHETQVLITTIDTHQATGKCDVCRKGQVVHFKVQSKMGRFVSTLIYWNLLFGLQ